MALSASVEAEIAHLDPEEQKEFLGGLGLSDLERGFIRAEAIPFPVFPEHRSEQAV